MTRKDPVPTLGNFILGLIVRKLKKTLWFQHPYKCPLTQPPPPYRYKNGTTGETKLEPLPTGDRGLMYPRPIRIWAAPFPRWLKTDQLCIDHRKTPGHSIESYVPFKNHVLTLIDSNWIDMSLNTEEGDQNGTSEETQERTNSGKRNIDLQEDNLKVKEENLNLREEIWCLKGEAKRDRVIKQTKRHNSVICPEFEDAFMAKPNTV
ncbi:uncharacterized protein G2W53_003908 [Senna tora]|uniref:Uncharacterized protein n=1 Tax=Senna tora TaxID=362788 RepID=A0A834XBK8_9FABA|nr:uncharacterized protein G2W53_003908 [Senna tora]